ACSASRVRPTDSRIEPRVSKNSPGSAAAWTRFCRSRTRSRAFGVCSRYVWRIHALLLTASTELGWALSTRSYSSTARRRGGGAGGGGGGGGGRVGRALGDGEWQVAEVEMGGGRVEPLGGVLGVGQRQLELAGLVQADGDGEDHRALGVAAGGLGGEPPGLG